MLDVRYSHLYFYQSLNRLQRGLSAIAELLVLKSGENMPISFSTVFALSAPRRCMRSAALAEQRQRHNNTTKYM